MDRCALHRVYRLVFPNGKSYVGQTRRLPRERFEEHAKNGSLVRRAIDKHGASSVRVQTLAIVPETDVDLAEKVFIAAYDSLVPSGYNIAGGGRGIMKAPDAGEYQKIRCAFWTARRAETFDEWERDCGFGDFEFAAEVFRYAKLTSSGNPDRAVF
jgi:hypothetical protein